MFDLNFAQEIDRKLLENDLKHLPKPVRKLLQTSWKLLINYSEKHPGILRPRRDSGIRKERIHNRFTKHSQKNKAANKIAANLSGNAHG